MDENLLHGKMKFIIILQILRRVGKMKIDYTKGNGLNFLEQLKLMKVVDKVSN